MSIEKINAKKLLMSTLLDGGTIQISPLMLYAHFIINPCGIPFFVACKGFKGLSIHESRGSLLKKEVMSINEYL